MTVNSTVSNMEPYVREFQNEMTHLKRVNDAANDVALEATDLLSTSITDFDNASRAMKAKFDSDISARDKTIRMMAIAILVLSGCVIALSVKILTKTCPTG